MTSEDEREELLDQKTDDRRCLSYSLKRDAKKKGSKVDSDADSKTSDDSYDSPSRSINEKSKHGRDSLPRNKSLLSRASVSCSSHHGYSKRHKKTGDREAYLEDRYKPKRESGGRHDDSDKDSRHQHVRRSRDFREPRRTSLIYDRSSVSPSKRCPSRCSQSRSARRRDSRDENRHTRREDSSEGFKGSNDRHSRVSTQRYKSGSRDQHLSGSRRYKRSPYKGRYEAPSSRSHYYRGKDKKHKRSISPNGYTSDERHSRSPLKSRKYRHSSCTASRSRSKSCNRERLGLQDQEKNTEHHESVSNTKPTTSEIAKPSKRSKWDVAVTDIGDVDGKIGWLAVDPERRVYISNLPPDTVDVSLVQFLNGALVAASGVDFTTAALTGFFPVSRVQLVAEQRYALVDLRTVADVSVCLQLNGIQFNGHALKISRVTDVVLPRPPAKPRPPETTNGMSSSAADVKVYVTDLPVTVTDEELRSICSRYGGVRSAALMKDLKTGQSMGCGVVEFDTPVSANAAVKALDRKAMGLKIPRFRKGLTLSGLGRLSETGERLMHTSSIVTELPTSVTYKIFSNAIVGAQVRAARQEGAKPSMVVQLLNAVFPEDLIKDEEYNAIMEDMRNEVSQYGTIVNIVIPRPPEDLSFMPGVGKVFLHFSDITAARRAQAELNGRRYDQRRTICAAFYNLERFLQAKYTLV